MIKVGITGQTGFIGTHLYNTLGLYPQEFERVPFEDSFFTDEKKLHEFVQTCNVIVHLAAMNRHNNPEVIFSTNIKLVQQVISACEETNSTPHILFASSIQEELNNIYGRSKKEGRELFEQWTYRNNASFTGLVIPNVFGPFGQPYYNSVVATFCYQLTHSDIPKIEIDGELKLIYIGELTNLIIKHIDAYLLQKEESVIQRKEIPYSTTINVSKLLEKLNQFKNEYYEKGEIPCLDDTFDRNLFNTFLCYIDHSCFFPFELKLNTDNRGTFIETVKLNSGGQVSFSTTKPGITRGNHYHTRKAERFAVIKGEAKIEFRRIGTDKIFSFILSGDKPSFVDMPVWYTHNITNIGKDELLTIFWISEHYDKNDPDTYFEEV